MRIFFQQWIICLWASYLKAYFLGLSGGQQSNEYDSLASSVADDDSTGMVGPSQPQQPPQLQRRQRRPALRNNQPKSVQSPAADKEGKSKNSTSNLSTTFQSMMRAARTQSNKQRSLILEVNHLWTQMQGFACTYLHGAVISKRLVNLNYFYKQRRCNWKAL